MVIYLSGGITGDMDYREKFKEYAKKLEETGHTVLHPAMLPETLTPAAGTRIRMAMIDAADEVVFLGDWEESEGAQLERGYCIRIGKPRRYPFGR